jgi:hypothetical protein
MCGRGKSTDLDFGFLRASNQPPRLESPFEIQATSICPENYSNGFQLDPLMGCATTLLPMIGQVALMTEKACRTGRNSPSLISEGNELMIALGAWDPPKQIWPAEDLTAQVKHAIQTGEALRWAVMLQLYLSIPELPSFSTAELAEKVLSYLATMPVASRTTIRHIYPLMIAGREVTNAEDRERVRGRWRAMASRVRTGAVDQAFLITEESWRRKDIYELGNTLAHRVMAVTGLSSVRHEADNLYLTHVGDEDASHERSGRSIDTFEGNQGKGHDVVSHVYHESSPHGTRLPSMPRLLRPIIGHMDPTHSIRGHLHSLKVMAEWRSSGKFQRLTPPARVYSDSFLVLLA